LRQQIFGGDSGGVTPVPIPNTEVKPSSADGTWAETPWESRSPPDPSPRARGAVPAGDGGLARASRHVPALVAGTVTAAGEKSRRGCCWAVGSLHSKSAWERHRHCRFRLGQVRRFGTSGLVVVCWLGWLLENGREDSTQRVRSVVGRRVLADVTPSMKCLAGSACCGWGWSPVPGWHSGSGLDHCRPSFPGGWRIL
jgi:hypothetical protein